MRIEDIDRNFKLPEALNRPDLVWFDVREEPFTIYGLYDAKNPDHTFMRMPQEVADSVSSGVSYLNRNTAGGRVRFTTDSPFVAIFCETNEPISMMSHMPLSGSQGFDLYQTDEETGVSTFTAAFFPPPTALGETAFSGIRDVGDAKRRSFTLNFPLYGTCRRLLVGLKKDALLEKGVSYRNDLPVVFYGSSITQGGCASRPGTSYQAYLSHTLNLDYINLGFSGNACGEPEMAAYLASLPMSVFVSDYDHNAWHLEDLQKTLPPLLAGVRAVYPDMTIVQLSSPAASTGLARRDYIRSHIESLQAAGDKHVFFIDGASVFEGDRALDSTVDGCHPTDLGFYWMYRALLPYLAGNG